MRNFYKAFKQQTVETICYNRKAKKEEVIKTTFYPDVQEAPTVPENCTVLETKVIEEKEVRLMQTPIEFIENGIIVTD